MIALLTGLIAGALHVLSGPDHLTAIAPLAAEDRRGAWRAGLRWGLGHASGVLLVGLLALALREVIPVDWLSSWAERLVGVVLIGIGLWSFRRALRQRVHVHEHEHDGHRHWHFHTHDHQHAHSPEEAKPHSHGHAALAVGTLHGLAGGSHFFGVVPALALASRAAAVEYLLAFGIGTIVAMIVFSQGIGWLAYRWELRSARAYTSLKLACSVAALVVGAWWLVN